MSGFWYEPENPAFFTGAGGEATLGEIFSASRDAALYVDNTFAAEAALEAWYDARNRSIFDLTGEKLSNPWRVSSAVSMASRRDSAFGLPDSYPEIRDRQARDWQHSVDDLARRRPELAGALLNGESPEQGALRITREAEERFTRLAGSRDGAGKWLAMFAGGAWGAVRDPMQVATLAVGGGPGASRTVMGRILTTAFSEAAVNAGVELALQPIVQSYRAKAGLESGVDIALQNAAFAGLLGGVFGAGARGIAEALTLGGRSADRAVAHAVDDLPPAMKTEIEAGLPEAIATVRDSLPLPARGGLDQAETIGHLDATRPAASAMEHHDVTVGQAHRAVEAGEPPAFRADQAQIERVARSMLGETADTAPANRPPTLVEFLKARGGVKDFSGELRAIDADVLFARNKPRKGKADKRLSLDMAREAAEEAGYIGRAGETQVTTVANLLDAIDRERRGDPVYSRADIDAVAAEASRPSEIERARVESTLAEVAAYAGPAVDDALLREAAEISLRDNVDAFDALERVLVRAESNEAKAAVAAARTGETLPGWSDAELEAASAGRGPEPMAENGGPFDDPGSAAQADASGIDGPFGQAFDADLFDGDWNAGVALLKDLQGGELRGFISHPDVGAIDVPWGHHDAATGQGAGLAHIVAKHPEVVARLPKIVTALKQVASRRANRIELDDPDHHATVRIDYDGEAKTWLLTAFRKDESPRAGETTPRPDDHQEGGSPSSRAGDTVAEDDAVAKLMAEREAADPMVPGEDGQPVRLSQFQDEIKAADAMAAAVQACRV